MTLYIRHYLQVLVAIFQIAFDAFGIQLDWLGCEKV